MVTIVWWNGMDGVYYREGIGPIIKQGSREDDLPEWIWEAFHVEQAPDEPDYVRWPQ